ncbi:sugar transferase [Halomicrococcus sp. SG-WS-1]|uniref:sugar transferase n=1 Tax=Halomicrococcus sp. SG-WS-1 TaxID=3439057 RepID=UPI003F7AAA84
MVSGLRYRVASAGGTVLLTALAVTAANHPAAQRLVTALVPVASRLPATVLQSKAFTLAVVTTVAVVTAVHVPLFKPRPRRVLDTILTTEKRVFTASLALATVGYFDYTYRLPRSTLIVTTALLAVALPLWLVTIRRRPGEDERVLIVGDDPAEITNVRNSIDGCVVGYVSPPSRYHVESENATRAAVADGGHVDRGLDERVDLDLERVGGLSRLGEMLVEYGVDTAVLAFSTSDRAEFFGALDTCNECGVTAKVHRDHVDSVLTTATTGNEEIVEIDLEPWDWQDYVFKRAFDVTFAAAGLLAFAPFIGIIAVAIKLDSPGPVFYSQERTAELGETFDVYKFRSMIPDAEAETGATVSEEDAGGVDPRVTRVGYVLRQTHLDEIPQLWSILVGDMSVVGPRPERPELDSDIETGVVEWRKRWFIKPGLTGLAQIHDATGHEPEKKLRYDLEYIRKQSFWFDCSIVVRQVWGVVSDVVAFGADDEE